MKKKASFDVIISLDSPVPSQPSSLSTHSSPNTLERLAIQARVDVQKYSDFVLRSQNTIPNPTLFSARFRRTLAAGAEYIVRHPPSPSTDLLLSVVSMNVLRAFGRNLKILGFDHIALFQVRAISPFFDNLTSTASPLPTDLQPTMVQKTIPHHPVYDIFPDPLLREQILLCRGQYDEMALCWDLVGWPDREHGNQDGLLVWGEPYRADSWEASEAFLSRYPALLSGFTNLITSSNRWRAFRGEPPLRVAKIRRYGQIN